MCSLPHTAAALLGDCVCVCVWASVCVRAGLFVCVWDAWNRTRKNKVSNLLGSYEVSK